MPPAARIADVHTCPQGGLCPHVGGPISEGDSTVLVSGAPLARVGDRADCVGASDSIAQGADTVLISGRQAARQGDPTAHGGVIVQGDATVLIGRVLGPAGVAGGAGEAGTDSYDCRGKKLYKQEKHMSCAEASSRMVIESQTCENVPEQTLRDESSMRTPGGYDEFNGTNSQDIPVMLIEHGVTPGRWQYGTTANVTAAANTGRPSILFLSNPNHFVVLDGIEHRADGDYLLIRDPGLPGAQGCREIKIGDTEWTNRTVDPTDPTKSAAQVLTMRR